MALLCSEYLGKSFNELLILSILYTDGLAPDEIEPGWSKHVHFSMPPVMRNSNIRTMLKDPLSSAELAGRNRSVPFRLCSAALIPAEMKLHMWLT